MSQNSDYLGIGEVAELFHTSRSALYTQRARGESPGNLGLKIGRRIVWRRSDLEEWFTHRRAVETARAV